ncbi:hypothetical protein [Algihabitans albus]|uniref:hypothetical protein n=1 Tax=Algihabitans albus TaxID=2164067 RepID=UPI0013C2B73A|nr:hypothetical protein [Algihabitans albus]
MRQRAQSRGSRPRSARGWKRRGIGRILAEHVAGRWPLPRWVIPTPLAILACPFAGVPLPFARRNLGYPLAFSSERAREGLGLALRPVETTLAEHFDQLVEQRAFDRA